MKIVLFNKQEKAGGGIGVFTKRLKDFLEKQGHEVFEIRYTNEPQSKEFVKVPYIYADKNMFIFLPSVWSKKIIEEALTQIKPELVYLPIGSSVFDFYLPGICRKLNIELMGVCHTDISRSAWWTAILTSWPFLAYLPVCQKVGKLQVFTKELRDFYIKFGVNPKNIIVIPNGVEEKRYFPGKSEFKVKNRITKAVLFIGRITWIKNPEILVKSFLEVADKNTKLVFMGQGDLMKKLKKNYSDDRVQFLGQINDEEKKIDIIRGCDIFVLPSIYEGMSLSLLEAMSCGLYCVVSDVASHREVLDGVGTVIPYQKINETLPGVLKTALENEKYRKNFGEKARARILKDYSQQAVFHRISKEFVNLTKNN